MRNDTTIGLILSLALGLGSCADEAPETRAAEPGAPRAEAPAAPSEAPVAPSRLDFAAAPFADGKAEFERVREMLAQKYYRELDEDALWGAAVQGMLEYVDPSMRAWNRLLTPAEMKALKDDLAGTLVGVGIWIEVDEDTGLAHVRAPLPRTPSERAGIERGDILVRVNAELCQDKTLEQIVSLIRGEAGTKVSLTVLRAGELRTFEMTRERVEIPSVEHAELPHEIGYLAIDNFHDKTVAAVESALGSLRDGGIEALIVDLRRNRGGALDDAIGTADLFVPKGSLIVTTRDRKEGAPAERRRLAEREPLTGELPMAVLTDGDTSSGAEFVAVALREAGGMLVGSKTRGKWSAQWLEKLDNGYGVKFTVGLIEGADGKRYEGVGVAPDIEVAPSSDGRHAADPPAERLASDGVLRTAHELLRRAAR